MCIRDRCRHGGHADDHRDVHLLDGLPGELADARPAEHRLDHHQPAHENADIDADHRDHRDDGVGQHVAGDHPQPAQALGAGGADEVLVQHLDHRGACHARVPAAAEHAKGQRRQQQVLNAAVATEREPAELHREEVEREHGGDELRRRHADEGEGLSLIHI